MQVSLLLALVMGYFSYACTKDLPKDKERQEDISDAEKPNTMPDRIKHLHTPRPKGPVHRPLSSEPANSFKPNAVYAESIDRMVKETLLTLKRQEEEMAKVKRVLASISSAARHLLVKSSPDPPKDKFVAVFDGGSTGTRLNIYQFNESGLVLKSHMFQKTNVGIHLSKTPGNDIKKLLTLGQTHLKSLGHEGGYNFPVVFNGTAGLRLIDENARSRVLKTVKEAIISETRKKPADIEVRVIDGKEEGFYAWAALVFTTQMKERIGIIDLGGGSAQISFEVDKDMQGVQDGIVHGKNKDVLSRSFLGMGLVAGLDRINRSDKNSVCKSGTSAFDINKCKVHIKNTIGAMMQERTQGKEVAPGISQVNTIFVSSFIAETLNVLKTPANSQFKDIKDFVGSVCSNNSINPSVHAGDSAKDTSNPSVQKVPELNCISILYAVMFMENLGVGLFTPIKNSTNIPTDISWSLGRALSLIE